MGAAMSSYNSVANSVRILVNEAPLIAIAIAFPIFLGGAHQSRRGESGLLTSFSMNYVIVGTGGRDYLSIKLTLFR